MTKNEWPLSNFGAKVLTSVYYIGSALMLVIASYFFGINFKETFQNESVAIACLLGSIVGVVIMLKFSDWRITSIGSLITCISFCGLIAYDLGDLESALYEMTFAMLAGVVMMIAILILKEEILKKWASNLAILVVILIVFFKIAPPIMPSMGLKSVQPSFPEIVFAFSIAGIIINGIRKVVSAKEKTVNLVVDSLPYIELFTQFLKRALGVKMSITLENKDEQSLAAIAKEELGKAVNFAQELPEMNYDKATYWIAVGHIYKGVTMLVELGVDAIPDTVENIFRQAIASRRRNKSS